MSEYIAGRRCNADPAIDTFESIGSVAGRIVQAAHSKVAAQMATNTSQTMMTGAGGITPPSPLSPGLYGDGGPGSD